MSFRFDIESLTETWQNQSFTLVTHPPNISDLAPGNYLRNFKTAPADDLKVSISILYK